MDANLLRRVNWLWKHRHTHTDDTGLKALGDRLTIIETRPGIATGSSSDGAHIHLRAATQAAGLISWGSVYPLIPARSMTVAGTQIRVLVSGYYSAHLRFAFDSSTVGGTVEVLRTSPGSAAVSIWPDASQPGRWSQPGTQFDGTASAIPCAAGDLLEFKVTPASGTPNIAWATVAVYRDDPSPIRYQAPTVVVYTANATFNPADHGNPPQVNVWVIAAGGWGGKGLFGGGGGGGGGVRANVPVMLDGSPVSVVVGAAVTDLNGQDSSFGTVVATGGGKGGGGTNTNGNPGGSGGGASPPDGGTPVGGAGTPGQGNDGGDGGGSFSNPRGGGGGGYSQQGGDAIVGNEGTAKGGDGIDLSLLVGTSLGDNGWFAGGGRGGGGNPVNGLGTGAAYSGGGGQGTPPETAYGGIVIVQIPGRY